MGKTIYDDFILAATSGLIPGYIGDTKFGHNDSIGTTQQTLWDGVGNYVYLDPGVTDKLSITSSNIADVDLVIEVTGQDLNNHEFTEIVTLDGANPTTTPVVTLNNFHRAYRAEVISPRINAGDISLISDAAGTPTLAIITAGEGQTQMALYTVPKGKTLLIHSAVATIQGAKIGTFRAKTRRPGMADFVTKRLYDVAAGPPAPIPVNAMVPEIYDYEVTAITDLSTAGFSVNILTVLIDNDRLIGRR